MSEAVDYWDWLMRYGMRSRNDVRGYDVALPAWPQVPPFTPLRDQVRMARAGARRMAEAEGRREWIGQVRRRLGLVSEVHRCWTWRLAPGEWAWACCRTGCTAGTVYPSQPAAYGDALAHARSCLPGPPPEEAPVTRLDLAVFDALWEAVQSEREAFTAALPARIAAVAEQVSEFLGGWLPEGLKFEWVTNDQ